MITQAFFWGLMFGSAVLYWSLPRWRDWFLVVVFAGCIAWLDWKSALFLGGFSALAYVTTQYTKRRWLSLVPAIGVAGFLAYYKYIPAIIDQVKREPDAKPLEVIVPLGASYFTFKLIHYVIECRRGHIKAHSFQSFLLYMSFMPMFTAGPIERFDDFMKNRTDKITIEQIYRGGTRIVYGLIKKFVIVDLVLTRHVTPDTNKLLQAIPLFRPSFPTDKLLEQLDHVNPLFVWQFVINQFVSFYVDFSAYCDIAIGLGLFFGVTLCENFDWPFNVTNVGDFWRRYHMSLSNWAQRYVYFPILGSTRNAHLALFATMIMIGLWHGGTLNYLAWGTYQALLLSVNLVWSRYKRRRIGQEDEPGWFSKVVENPAFGLAGGVVTFLGICASSAFQATNPMGIMAAFRIVAALVGFHIKAAA